ncbi:MAG: GNAT family N-acetyltransferase [Rhodobacteraceae bacterium]|nr:GNAT family N-acetyltransferase [Paracoccaceae bacterium]
MEGRSEALTLVEIIDARDNQGAAMAARDWGYAQWGAGNLARTEHAAWFQQTFLKSPMLEAAVPVCLVALVEGAPAATACLVGDDGLGPPYDPIAGATPWIASVYTAPAFRRRGLAAHLVRACLDRLAAVSVDQVYLYTPDQQRLYANLGFEAVALARTRQGEEVTVMWRRVSP